MEINDYISPGHGVDDHLAAPRKLRLRASLAQKVEDVALELSHSRLTYEKVFEVFDDWHGKLTLSTRRLFFSITSFTIIAAFIGADLDDASVIGIDLNTENLDRLALLASVTIVGCALVYAVSRWIDSTVRAGRVDLLGADFKRQTANVAFLESTARELGKTVEDLLADFRDGYGGYTYHDRDAYWAIEYYHRKIKRPHRIRKLMDWGDVPLMYIFGVGSLTIMAPLTWSAVRSLLGV